MQVQRFVVSSVNRVGTTGLNPMQTFLFAQISSDTTWFIFRFLSVNRNQHLLFHLSCKITNGWDWEDMICLERLTVGHWIVNMPPARITPPPFSVSLEPLMNKQPQFSLNKQLIKCADRHRRPQLFTATSESQRSPEFNLKTVEKVVTSS